LVLSLSVMFVLFLGASGALLLYRYLASAEPGPQPSVVAHPMKETTPAPAKENLPPEPVVKSPSAPKESAPPINKPAETPPTNFAICKPASPGPEVFLKPPPGEPKPVAKAPDRKPEPRRPFKEGDTFLQDLLVTQKSRFVVLGLPVTTQLQYRIGSRITIQKVDADGTLAVRQKVEAAALVQADELTKGLVAGPIAKLPGTEFALTVTARGEVKAIGGAGGPVRFGAGNMAGGFGVQMASLLDADGWKELAEATFFQPEAVDRPGLWARPMTHNWGPLGGWVGQIAFAYPGLDRPPQAQVKVPYALKLAYQAPQGAAPGGQPVQVVASKFQAPEAGGALLYDVQHGKTAAAEERFFVRGTLVMNLLGQNTPAEIEEEQLFQMRILAK
jgi:hypothetical protein